MHNADCTLLPHGGWNKMTAVWQTIFFKCLSVNENHCMFIKMPLNFVLNGSINESIQVLSWRWIGNKQFPEPMMTQLSDAYMRQWIPFRKIRSQFKYNYAFVAIKSHMCSPATYPCPMMTSSNGNIFRVTGHLCGKFTGPRWIPHTKASDVELWCLLWSAPE